MCLKLIWEVTSTALIVRQKVVQLQLQVLKRVLCWHLRCNLRNQTVGREIQEKEYPAFFKKGVTHDSSFIHCNLVNYFAQQCIG